MSASLTIAVPSKGRLMEQTTEVLGKHGIVIAKTGNERGYRGAVAGHDDVEVAFVSASEIAGHIKSGAVHLGVTGEDLLREAIPDADTRVEFIAPLGFGRADVVVAVPKFWIDVATMADLEAAAVLYRRRHGRRMRVATKYTSLTRRFFAGQRIGKAGEPPAAPVTGYLIVESLGATEGAPAAGTAELIVDITTTGSTLEANGLRILDDGVILRSEANLVASRAASWTPEAVAARKRLLAGLQQMG